MRYVACVQMIHALLAVLGSLHAVAFSTINSCPCSNQAWCEPISTPMRNEVVAFHPSALGNTWMSYDWTLVTTVAVFGSVDPALLCRAHEAGSRVVIGADYPHDQFSNATNVEAWITAQISTMQANFTDGINLDIEGNTANASALTTFTQTVAAAFRGANPWAQVTFDTSIYPTSSYVDGGYDLAGLAAACDFLIAMGYDMDWASNPARANSPYPLLAQGIQGYTVNLSIPADKVVLGVPWYGYDFPCQNAYMQPAGGKAAKCDAPGFSGSWSRTYAGIMQSALPQSYAGIQYDSDSKSAWVDYNVSDSWHQLWFDDPVTLGYKYALAKSTGIRGVAMWTADFCNYTDGGAQSAAMWGSIRKNFM